MQKICKLFPFYKAVGGNWRNAIYVFCDCSVCPYENTKPCRGYLLCANADGVPMLVSIRQLEAATGESIEPAQCCGAISREAFELAFSQYILWQLPDTQQCPLRVFSQNFCCR